LLWLAYLCLNEAMEKTWLEVRILLPAASVDLVSQSLTEVGCLGAIVDEVPLDTFFPPDPDETHSGNHPLRCFFPGDRSPESLRRDVLELLQSLAPLLPDPAPVIIDICPVVQEDWADGWRQQFQPLRVGSRLVIKPSWEPWPAKEKDVIVELDPGMAFGTGTHPTTRLCLQALAAEFETDRSPLRVLDVGTGSGILAMAAAALGASRVLACDIDPEACLVAKENARRNSLQQRIEFSAGPLDRLLGAFDMVLANILAEENIRMAPDLVDRLAPAGVLILSGILREKENAVAEAFDVYPWSARSVLREEDWVCLCYRRP